MKLERIHVDQFGAWKNLDLPVDPEGISVYYGPNEAGKTTLMRFVRGVLYGFPESHELGFEGADSWRGALQVQHESDSWVVERAGSDGSRGLVSARNADLGLGSHPDGASLVGELVDDVSENVFENVFAIGLYELQELATLESREVAEQIYALSLGLDGQQLLDQIEAIRVASLKLLDSENNSGRLAELQTRLEEIDHELDAPTGVRRRHGLLWEQQGQFEDSIIELKQRQAGLEDQLHGHEYMQQVHAPWLKVRRFEQELAKFPDLPDFPHEGLHNLESIETELAEIRGRRNALSIEAKKLKEQANELEFDPLFIRYSPVVQGFIDQRDWIRDLQESASEAEYETDDLREQLEAKLEQLGENWDEDRLAAVDSSHLASDCLSLRASEFRSSNRRNNKLQRRYRRLNRKFHQRQEQLEKLRNQLGDIRIEDAIERTRGELSQLEDLSRLRIRETELNQRRIGLANQLHRMTINPALPQWVYAVFAALGISGGVLGLIGLFMGLTTNGVGGFVYMCLGLVCGGLTFSLNQHFEGEVERTMTELRSELRELELRLVETRDAMKRVAPVIFKLQDDSSEKPDVAQVDNSVKALVDAIARQKQDNTANGDAAPDLLSKADHPPRSTDELREVSTDPRERDVSGSRLSEADLVRQCLDRLQSLEKMVRVERWVDETRQTLIDMRLRIRDLQRDFGVARQNWGTHLVEQGLEETIDIDAALEQRDQVARAALLQQRLKSLEGDTHSSTKIVEQLRKRVEELGHRLEQWDANYTDPIAVLDAWGEKLIESTRAREERVRLRRAAKVCRRDATKFRSRVRELNAKRAAILVRGGAVSRDEFAERAIQLESRFEVQEQVERARQELAAVASGERSMAIVESDLDNYDEAQNTECIQTIRNELDDLSLDIEEAFEKLGRLKQEIEDLESDRSVAELRFDREQVLAELTELAEEWFALEWTLGTLEELRVEFEKNHQPPILARAKEYLEKLSGGRYPNIWTPLGKRTLCVDDRDGNTLIVENLSGGTREQLFLAIRFALIEHYSDAGVELPVILDDVLVNFDQDRTQAAIEVLLKKTSENQQILFFTCHQHLAEMFRQRGVSTVTLPTRATSSIDESDELLAG
jgi:uncharacterized protein YhaN